MVDLGGYRQRRRSTCVHWGNALDQPRDWSEYDGDEKEDQRHFADAADQWAVGGLIEPHQIVVLSLLGGVAGIVLRFEVFNAEHIIGSGDVREQGCDDKSDADNVKPAGFRRRDVRLTGDTNGPDEGQPAQQ